MSSRNEQKILKTSFDVMPSLKSHFIKNWNFRSKPWNEVSHRILKKASEIFGMK